MTRKLFVHGLLIDGNGGQPVEESAMLVEDHKIKAIGKAADFTSCEPDVEIIDCRGKILMPGLINGHVHIFMEPYTWDREKFMQEPLSLLCVEIIDNLHKTLRSGVTYVRDLGGYQDLDLQFRDYIDEGKVLGPNMICARHPLTITGGHGRDFGLECDGATAFIRGVREQIRAGADVIKIMPTAGYSRPKMKVNHNIVADTIYMSPMEIKAACDEAHKMGKMVAAHCCGYTGVYHAVMNGVDTIEHGQFRDTTGAEIPQLIEEMVKRGTWLVPTLAAYFKEYERAESEQNYQSVIETFRLCHQAGVKIALGTDAGV
ncbi:MAG: amidohydrolase family protein, partial [Clostridiales bacterium]